MKTVHHAEVFISALPQYGEKHPPHSKMSFAIKWSIYNEFQDIYYIFLSRMISLQ
jgi:hypothetical protein